ncbi:hypothetical protein SLA2020_119140 [Shorea laevis]
MEEPNRSSTIASSSSHSVNREDSGAAASSSNSYSEVREEVEDRYQQPFHNPDLEHHHNGVTYRGNFFAFDDGQELISDDTWSCIIVVLTFWFFVSMTLILGVYGSSNIVLGPNCSLLIQPSSIFVQSITVEQLVDTANGIEFYGFYNTPPLNVETNWSEAYVVTVEADNHKEWIHYLNEGSQVDISYTVNSGASVFLIIAQGNEGLANWLQDPTYPNTTLSWNVVHGSGVIQQDIYKSSSYYIALGNLNSENVEVELNVRVRAWKYNTTEAYYKCTFTQGRCSLSVLFPKENSVVLTSSGPNPNTSADDLSVQLSYGPRWITYLFGIGGMTLIMWAAFNFLNKFQCHRHREDDSRNQYAEVGSERAPLLSRKDDDLSSWGSSYDSLSNDEDDLEEFLEASTSQGTSLRDGENSNNTRRLCAICFDAPRDCFFLPCGHCVACFECGTRIAEADGICPICRRIMKKVRMIFTV